mgnify:CR=1 FL=1
MCIIVHMTDYSKQKLATKYLRLKDMGTALQYGDLPNDRRVQLKLPEAIVEDLEMLNQAEQHDLDKMWDYLEERTYFSS